MGVNTPSTLFCPHCGAANDPLAKVCNICQRDLSIDLADAESSSSILIGDRYQVISQLGSGGYGAVYRARDTHNQDREVAVKQINLRGLSVSEIIEATDTFNREARLLSQLDHPQFPKIHHQFHDPDHWYLVMDYLQGKTLEQYVHHQGQCLLPIDQVLNIALQLCLALDYLHAQVPPIIFRDLKPSNIIIAPNGRVSLVDFGIARAYKPGKVKDTIPLGSPGYAAPEQYGRMQTTPRSDIYSLGAVLHHLISGYDPADNPMNFPTLYLGYLPAGNQLSTLVAQMVQMDPEDRPQSIQEVATELRRICMWQEVRYISPHLYGIDLQNSPPSTGGGLQQTQIGMQQMVIQQNSQNNASNQKMNRRKFGLGIAAILGGVVALRVLGNRNSDNPSITSVYDVPTAQDTKPGISPFNKPLWSYDGRYKATFENVQKTVRIYDVQKRREQSILFPNLTGDFFGGRWSAHGNRLAV